jgi:hypothetical protein
LRDIDFDLGRRKVTLKIEQLESSVQYIASKQSWNTS